MTPDAARDLLDLAASEFAQADLLEKEAQHLRKQAITRIATTAGIIGDAIRDARSQRMSAAQIHRHARRHATS